MRRGSPLPDFQQEVLFYEKYLREDSMATIVLFWSISCQQCIHAFNVLADVRSRYKHVNIIAVHMPRSADDKNIQEIKRKYKQYRLQVPLLIDQNLVLSKQFGNHFVPSIYVFDNSGLRFAQAGQQNWRFFLQRIEKILS